MSFYDSKTSRLWAAQYHLSGVVTGAEFVGRVELPDVTTLNDSGQKSVRGIARDAISLDLLFEDTATTGGDVALNTLRAATDGAVFSYWPGGATIGNYGLSAVTAMHQDDAYSSRVAAAVAGRMTARANGQFRRTRSLSPGDTVVATDNNGSFNEGGAPSVTTGTLIYHVVAFSASGGNARWQLILQDSPDDAVWSDVLTVNITAVGGFSAAVTGATQQYVRRRLVLDATSGSLTSQVSFARH